MTPTELATHLARYIRRELELPAQEAAAPGNNAGIRIPLADGSELLVIVGWAHRGGVPVGAAAEDPFAGDPPDGGHDAGEIED